MPLYPEACPCSANLRCLNAYIVITGLENDRLDREWSRYTCLAVLGPFVRDKTHDNQSNDRDTSKDTQTNG